MRYVVRAAANRPAGPRVDDVEGERRLDADRRMQCRRRTPGAEAHARDVFARDARRRKRQSTSIARDGVPARRCARDLDLHAFDRRIDEARRAAEADLLAKNMPWLD